MTTTAPPSSGSIDGWVAVQRFSMIVTIGIIAGGYALLWAVSVPELVPMTMGGSVIAGAILTGIPVLLTQIQLDVLRRGHGEIGPFLTLVAMGLYLIATLVAVVVAQRWWWILLVLGIGFWYLFGTGFARKCTEKIENIVDNDGGDMTPPHGFRQRLGAGVITAEVLTVLIILPCVIGVYASVVALPGGWPGSAFGAHVIGGVVAALTITSCHRLASTPPEERRRYFGSAVMTGTVLAAAMISAMHQSWNLLAFATITGAVWFFFAWFAAGLHWEASRKRDRAVT